MTFQTSRFARAAALVCERDGVNLAGLNDAELVELQRELGEVARAQAVLNAEVAGEIAARAAANPGPRSIARKVGFRNEKQLIAETLGTSAGQAGLLLEAGKGLKQADAEASQVQQSPGRELAGREAPGREAPGWPLAAAALRDGAITVDKFEVITKTLTLLEADAEGERQFVELARRLKIYDLKRVCDREIKLGDPGGAEARERRQYESRYLRLFEDMHGMTVVEGKLDPASAGHFKAWLDKQVRAAFQAKRENSTDVRTADQIRVDALAMLAHHAMDCEAPGSGVKTTLVVRASLEELRKGVGFGECDALGGPMSVGTLRAMCADAQVVPMVLGGGSVPLDVGYAKRLATPYQRLAIAERDGGCAWCHAPVSFCDVHHIESWLDGGPTDLNNLVMLCVSCHHSMHYGRWRIEVEGGVVWFTPPPEVDPTRTRRKGGLAHLALDSRT